MEVSRVPPRVRVLPWRWMWAPYRSLNDYLVSEAQGFDGGIWIMWNASVVNVKLNSMDDQFINVVIDSFQNAKWILTAVYASPKLVLRRSLWLYLEELGRVMSLPWLLLGDFNQVLRRSEKRGGGPLRAQNTHQFAHMISVYALLDLGFSGPAFTWDNMRQGCCNIKERLDRALCNHDWVQLFSAATVQHLPCTRSDHVPLLLSSPASSPLRHLPDLCRLSAAWFDQPSFISLVEHTWSVTP